MRSIRCLALAAALVFHPTATIADSPPAAPADARVDSPSHRFFAVSKLAERQITVYRVDKGAAAERWRMPGTFVVAGLSDDGDHLVVSHPGGNLLPLGHAPNETVLWFYERGRLVREVGLLEIAPDPSHLEHTVSHVRWADVLGFDAANHFRVRTVDGKVLAFDPATGRPPVASHDSPTGAQGTSDNPGKP
jgi:hypothetical protein